MSSTVTIGGDTSGLVKAEDDVIKKTAAMTEAFKKAGQESKQTQRFAKKAWEDSLTPLEKYDRKLKQLRQEQKRGQLTAREYAAAVDKVNRELREQASGGALASIGTKAAGILSTFVGVSAIVNRIAAGYDVWQQTAEELAETTRKTADSVVTFAALQPEGEMQSAARDVLRRSRGALSPSEAFEVAQATQSDLGSREAGLRALDAIVDAVRVDIPVDVARNLASQASAQGFAPRDFINMAHIAGEASPGNPAKIGRAVQAFINYEDKDFAFAAAAGLVGSKGTETRTAVKDLEIALNDVSKAMPTFAELGVGIGATKEQRLRALAAAGVDTKPKLVAAGLSEQNRIDAVVLAIQNLPKIDVALAALQAGKGTDPISTQRARVERGVPTVAMQRLIDEEIAETQEISAFNLGAQAKQLRRAKIGQEMRRRGVEHIYGIDAIDAEGKFTDSFSVHAMLKLQQLLQFLATGPTGEAPATGAQQAIEAADRQMSENMKAIRENTAKPTVSIATPEN